MAHLAEVARQIPGVLSVHRLRSRPLGGHMLVDLSIRVPFHSTVSMAHLIAERVRQTLMETSDAYGLPYVS
jgi:divalent metal cation (Fe/Co/Zn/Cd) transporter